MKNNSIKHITTLTPFPLPITKTGTVDSSGTVVTGTGTDFSKEVQVGDWMWDGSELKEIIGVSYDRETLNVDSAFSVPLVGAALNVVPKSEYEEISVSNVGNMDTTIDGEVFVKGLSASWDKAEKMPGSTVDPLVLDGATSPLTVQFQK
jgi:hypothetical protein